MQALDLRVPGMLRSGMSTHIFECSRCGAFLVSDRRRRSDAGPLCRPCKQAVNKRRWEAVHREEIAAKKKAWREEHIDHIKAQKKAHYWANRETDLAKSRAWRKANPEKKKAVAKAYYWATRESDLAASKARHAANPEPGRAKTKAWRLANLERAKANSEASGKAWRKRNPEAVIVNNGKRRAYLRQGDLTPAEWKVILEASGGLCAYCKEPRAKTHLDHVHPLSKGGEHSAVNVVPACGFCNLSKGAKTTWSPNRLIPSELIV